MARRKKIPARRRPAASKKTQQSTPANKQTLQGALRNNLPQALIGVAVVLGLIVIGYNASRKNTPEIPNQTVGPSAAATVSASITGEMTVTPQSTTATASLVPSFTPSPTPTKASSANDQKPVVKKLPATSSEKIYYTVKNGDNSAKIGLKYCGDKRAWLSIVEENNLYPPYLLQPGDIITISCPSISPGR